jgi:hypothetical protein
MVRVQLEPYEVSAQEEWERLSRLGSVNEGRSFE